jgi:hypothetical protein
MRGFVGSLDGRRGSRIAADPRMSESHNRVVSVRDFGGPDQIQVVDAPLPTPGRGEVRVRVLASSLEFTDVTIRRHLYLQTMARRPPFVLGYDLVGEIDAIGGAFADSSSEIASPISRCSGPMRPTGRCGPTTWSAYPTASTPQRRPR